MTTTDALVTGLTLRVGDFDYARTVFPLGGRRGEKVRFTVVNRDGKTSMTSLSAPMNTSPYVATAMQDRANNRPKNGRPALSMPWRAVDPRAKHLFAPNRLRPLLGEDLKASVQSGLPSTAPDTGRVLLRRKITVRIEISCRGWQKYGHDE